MLYRGDIINNRIYIKIFEDFKSLRKYIENENVAVVSEDTPLLSELNAIENISLILEYHNNLKIKKAEKFTLELLSKSGLKELSRKMPFELNKKDRMLIQFLRAYVSNHKKISIIKPFSIIDRFDDIEYIIKMSHIFTDKNVEIVDTTLYNYYKENKCLTIK